MSNPRPSRPSAENPQQGQNASYNASMGAISRAASDGLRGRIEAMYVEFRVDERGPRAFVTTFTGKGKVR